jgi:LacI family transcriptional regulator
MERKKSIRVTLKDIAAKVGVDKSAVSLALSDRTAGRLSPERVRQIREVAAQFGYRPNLSAAHLSRGKTECIGVVLNYLDLYPHNHYFNLISQACVKSGYHAVPLAIEGGSLFDRSQAISLGRVHVDGMIVLDYMPAEDASDLQDRLPGQPLVCRMVDPTLNRPNFPSVMVDYYDGTCTLLRHIVQRGWRRFQFIVEDGTERPHPQKGGRPLAAYHERAIRDSAQALGLAIPYEQNMIRTPERGAKCRYDMMMQYLKRHRLEPGLCLVQDGADGISGTYAALIKMGYVIGRDVAVAALQAIPAWEHVEPVATFTWERYEEISRLLVELAVDGIEGRRKFSRNAQFNYSTSFHEFGAVPDVTVDSVA